MRTQRGRFSRIRRSSQKNNEKLKDWQARTAQDIGPIITGYLGVLMNYLKCSQHDGLMGMNKVWRAARFTSLKKETVDQLNDWDQKRETVRAKLSATFPEGGRVTREASASALPQKQFRRSYLDGAGSVAGALVTALRRRDHRMIRVDGHDHCFHRFQFCQRLAARIHRRLAMAIEIIRRAFQQHFGMAQKINGLAIVPPRRRAWIAG